MSLLPGIALSAMLAMSACAASAQGGDAYPTGLDLIKRCNALNRPPPNDPADPEIEQDYGYCVGFLVGYVSGFAAREVGGQHSLFCPPETAKIRDFMDAIQGWLVEHPEGLDQLGAYIAGEAFRWKFPCP